MLHCRKALPIALVWFFLALAMPGQTGLLAVQSSTEKAIKLYKQAQKEKDINRKIALLQQAITQKADFTDALYELGVIFRKDAQYLRAVKILEQAKNSMDESTSPERRFEIYYELAQCYSRTGDFRKYEQNLRKTEQQTNNNAIRSKLIFDLASLYFKQSRYQEALDELNRGIDLEASNRSFYENLIALTRKNIQLEQAYRIALEAKKNGNYAHALEIFDSIHKITPGFRNVTAQIAELNTLLSAALDTSQRAEKDVPQPAANDNTAAIAAAHPDQARTDADTGQAVIANPAVQATDSTALALQTETTPARIDSTFRLALDAEILDSSEGLEIDEETVAKWQNMAVIDSLLSATRSALDSADAERAAELLAQLMELAPNSRDVWLLEKRLTRSFPHQAAVLKTNSMRMRATRYLTGFLMVILPVAGFIALFPGPRAQYLIALKKYDAAAGIYERLIEKQPERLELYPKLARLYLLTNKRHDFALYIYKTIVQLKLEMENRDKITTILTQAYLKEATPDSDAIQLLENLLKEEQNRKSRDGDDTSS
ncbi:MAG TPA: tetratricopeptide repeat protein [Bacteroidetes bacterium]|nr:tetratricopeptide repeat protein [Bacteroidota bacterium]